jgi:hypothetical protein
MQDGHWAPTPPADMMLCHGGRVCAHFAGRDVMGCGDTHFVDAITGLDLPCATMQGAMADTSGAVMWRNGDDKLIACGGPHSTGCALAPAFSGHIVAFCYGVCVVHRGHERYVVRFDGDAVAVELESKVSVEDAGGANVVLMQKQKLC